MEKENFRILVDGTEKLVPKSDFLSRYHVFGLLRVQSADFNNIDRQQSFYSHFNLGHTKHKVGESYLVIKILENGVYESESGAGIEPLLDERDAFVCECVSVVGPMPISDVPDEYFYYAQIDEKDKTSLAKSLFNRYRYSWPTLSKSDLLAKGVTYTGLKFNLSL